MLKKKQLDIVNYHRHWCKDALNALKHGKKVKPYRIFLSGPGGVGKSHIITLIQSDTIKLLKLSGTIEPGQVTVLLTAPTGVAAFNVGGVTLHSALLLGCNKFHGYKPLTADKLNTLRSRLMSLKLLIIDEVSMVGSNMLLEIHKRLQEIKGASAEKTFGEKSAYSQLVTYTNYHQYVNFISLISYQIHMQDFIKQVPYGEMNFSYSSLIKS